MMEGGGGARTPARTRVLLVEDHAIVRTALRRSLARDFVVVGEAGDGEAALRAIALLCPEVAIVDIAMQPMDGLQLSSRLREQADAPAVVILTADTRRDIAQRSVAAGAFSCVLKSASMAELRGAIRAAADSRRGSRCGTSLRALTRDGVTALSTRELEVLALLADGCGRTQIGAHLAISARTADVHRAAILRKLGVTSTAEAARIAERAGVVRGDPHHGRDR